MKRFTIVVLCVLTSQASAVTFSIFGGAGAMGTRAQAEAWIGGVMVAEQQPDEDYFPAAGGLLDLKTNYAGNRTISSNCLLNNAPLHRSEGNAKTTLKWPRHLNNFGVPYTFNTAALESTDQRLCQTMSTQSGVEAYASAAVGISAELDYKIDDPAATNHNVVHIVLKLKVDRSNSEGPKPLNFNDNRRVYAMHNDGTQVEEQYVTAYWAPTGQWIIAQKLRGPNGQWDVGGNHVHTEILPMGQELDIERHAYMWVGGQNSIWRIGQMVSTDLIPIVDRGFFLSERLNSWSMPSHSQPEELDNPILDGETIAEIVSVQSSVVVPE